MTSDLADDRIMAIAEKAATECGRVLLQAGVIMSPWMLVKPIAAALSEGVQGASVLADVLEVLEAVRDELDNRADAEYTSEGGQIGNWAMNLMADVDRVIAKVERLV